tara:strand:+ start:33691 stop:34929 length:1239 start_codon:yes stop_codon:yes gene_type:complete
MFFAVLSRRLSACLCVVLLFPVSAAAAPADDWLVWFGGQINQHPDVMAARETMNAAFSLADNAELPLYNPELEAEYEREEQANNYRVGFSQTIDWWDKRAVQQQQAVFDRSAAGYEFELARQTVAAQALQAIVDWHAAQRLSELAQEQESQLDALLEVVQARQESGDLAQLDAELTYLGLSQRLYDTAAAAAFWNEARARLTTLLPGWSQGHGGVPDIVWGSALDAPVAELVDSHPLVLAQQAKWQVAQQNAERVRRAARADPTLGLNAGRSTEGDVAAVSLSIPINVRNNYSGLSRAASQDALAIEAQYRSVRQRQLAQAAAARANLLAYERQYQRWQSLAAGRGERSNNLLQEKWAQGDLGTTDYLLALEQRAAGLTAGIELEQRYRSARIDWMLISGQLDAVLAPRTTQ